MTIPWPTALDIFKHLFQVPGAKKWWTTNVYGKNKIKISRAEELWPEFFSIGFATHDENTGPTCLEMFQEQHMKKGLSIVYGHLNPIKSI